VLSTLALVFLCGSVVGAAAARTYLHARLAPAVVTRTPAIETARSLGLASLKARLNLSPEQVQVVTKILDDYGKFYQNIEDEREDVAEYGRKRLLETLSADQREEFNRMIVRKRPN
jgi:hypothetical protein